jgi:S-formylglutathione hydrolase FrmB
MGTWSETFVAGHPCDLFEPDQPSEERFVVIYLHGVHLTRLVGNAAFSGVFEQHGLRVIAPRTGRSWWTDRVCAEFDASLTAERFVREHVLAEIAQRWDARPPQIGLLGTSMGGQGALRLAYKYPQLFPVVAALAPAIDYYKRMADGDETLPLIYRDAEAARQDSAILHIHPLNWPRNQFFACDPSDERWFDSADRLRMKLYSLGVPHEADLTTTGGGHSFDYYNLMAAKAVGYLAERLQSERRRVV